VRNAGFTHSKRRCCEHPDRIYHKPSGFNYIHRRHYNAFYSYADSSSEQAMRAGFTDLGSVIARDITNMYLASAYSNDIVTLNVTRDIPLTIGGKGYKIELKNATKDHSASIDIVESGFTGYRVSTTLSSIHDPVNTRGIVYSGSGAINIRFKKNESRWLWIN